MTPICVACLLGLAKVAVALLDGGADIDFTTPPRHECPGFTPLMFAAEGNHAGVAKLLLERGADGTKTTIQATAWIAAGSTAIDIARTRAEGNPDYAETLAVLRLMCCSTCGVTSAGLPAAAAGVERRLKHCARCPADDTRAHYCAEDCQRKDWVARHRGECAEARRARQAAGTEV